MFFKSPCQNQERGGPDLYTGAGYRFAALFDNITRHGEYILKAPARIQEVFIGEYADFRHCSDDENGVCRFRKSYTVGDKDLHKCNGRTFEIYNPSGGQAGRLPEFVRCIYPVKKLLYKFSLHLQSERRHLCL